MRVSRASWRPSLLALFLIPIPAVAMRPARSEDIFGTEEVEEGGSALAMLRFVVSSDRPPQHAAAQQGNATARYAVARKDPLPTLPEVAHSPHAAGDPTSSHRGSMKEGQWLAHDAVHANGHIGCDRKFGMPGRSCHLGCTCGILQKCHPTPRTSMASTGNGTLDVGTCSLSIPAPLLIMVALAALAMLLGYGVSRLCHRLGERRFSGDARRLGMQRAELEARIWAATKLGAEQRCAILDHFCGSEAAVLAKAEVAKAAPKAYRSP
mmetsp:Transcript_129725/g.361342  ORF Transcript_129725/g.361342 Transcript_129725/m.361342 type:complete len:266 (+) Transcript_129725:102-899(+)